MVTATKGILINCEPSVKEILLHLDTTLHFIIEDLDPGHLFVDPSQMDLVEEEVRKILAENVYRPPNF